MPFLERAVEVSRTWNVRFLLPSAVSALGSAYTLVGRLSEALPLLEEGVAQAGGAVWITGLTATIEQAAGYLAAGRTDEAGELAERAVTQATERKARGSLARALRLLGEINVERNPIAASRAEECYRQALTTSSELGMRPLAAHCHFGLGKLYRRTGDQAKADEHLAGAQAMYREMGMGFWLEKADTNLKSPLSRSY